MTIHEDAFSVFKQKERENSPWVEAQDIDWGDLTQGLVVRQYQKGDCIYEQEQENPYVYLIKTGRVRLDVYSVGGGKRSILVAGVGAMFGELTPLDHMPCVCNATASVDSQIYLIPVAFFLEQLQTNHQFTLNLLHLVIRKTRLMAASIKQMSFHSSSSRVAYALANLSAQYSTGLPDGTRRLTMRFTQQEMADLTGLSRVSVSQIFREFTAKKIIKKEDGHIVIKDINALYEQCFVSNL